MFARKSKSLSQPLLFFTLIFIIDLHDHPALAQVFLLFALFAYSRTLSPEWRGFKHWVLDAFCFVGVFPKSWTDCLETPADVLEEMKERVRCHCFFYLRLSLAALVSFWCLCFCLFILDENRPHSD